MTKTKNRLRNNKRCTPVLPFIAVVVALIAVTSLYGEDDGELEGGTSALFRGDYQQAVSLAKKHLKHHPDDPQGLILLARAKMAQGEYHTAYEALREALRIDPKNIDALYYLSMIAGVLSQIEYQELYRLGPDSARVHQLLAESYRTQEKMAEAEAEYQAALKADPQSLEVLVALGDLMRSQRRYDEAISYYLRTIKLHPNNYDSIYGLGVCYHFQQKSAKAISHFHRALNLDPESAPARLALGLSFLRTDRPTAAIKELKMAISIEPKMDQAYYLLGRAYQKLGRSQEAAEAFKKAEELRKSEHRSAQELLTAQP